MTASSDFYAFLALYSSILIVSSMTYCYQRYHSVCGSAGEALRLFLAAVLDTCFGSNILTASQEEVEMCLPGKCS